MSDQPADNSELLNFIASTVEAMRQQMATKEDVSELRGEMENLRGEMLERVSSLRDEMRERTDGLRDEMRERTNGLSRDITQMRNEMATQEDVLTLGSDIARLQTKTEVQFTAVRGDIEQVHLRLNSIDDKLDLRLTRVESEVRRLRSAVYLLAKDRPDVLRLIGRESE